MTRRTELTARQAVRHANRAVLREDMMTRLCDGQNYGHAFERHVGTLDFMPRDRADMKRLYFVHAMERLATELQSTGHDTAAEQEDARPWLDEIEARGTSLSC